MEDGLHWTEALGGIQMRIIDPVCGMAIESETAAAESSYDGDTFYFCSVECKQQFAAEPSRYVGKASLNNSDREVPLERHEAPHTKAGGIVAPKFGSARSGGAEYERLPDAPDRDKT